MHSISTSSLSIELNSKVLFCIDTAAHTAHDLDVALLIKVDDNLNADDRKGDPRMHNKDDEGERPVEAVLVVDPTKATRDAGSDAEMCLIL